MRISDALSESWGFAQEALFGKWVRWIMLVISSIIFPIMYGYTVRVMRGNQPVYEEESFFGLFIDGVKLCIINIVYMIIPMLVLFATIGYALFGIIISGKEITINSVLPILGGFITGILIFIFLAIIFGMVGIIGSVRFARTGSMGEAFAIGEIVSTIGRIGWIHYIVSLLALMVVVFILMTVVTIIELMLIIIPVVGWIVGWVLSMFLGPFISLMSSRFYSLLYDSGI
ncbi:DUF4013 domain-containing protein [Methanospirillum lacunae]|uniref:DUF4013 domain-containing protein n=1 Tax=Methanospirillum lacunae TaxID=668570 RepID=A0A2V2NFD1_9EURY|nr:DUF4013 domain-containing protein [Methanospirillum lacunae]PWR74301.1 hypothetical protein DK846_03915 [Methanospirillum lacunae]